MQNTIMTITIITGSVATIISFISLTLSLIKKYKANEKFASFRDPDWLTIINFVSKKNRERIFKEIATTDISIRCNFINDKFDKNKLDMFNLGINMYILFQLQLLPWMTADMMKNTVTDTLGLDLSKCEKQYAYLVIKDSLEKCKRSLTSPVRESVEKTFNRVLEQIMV